MEYYQKKQRIIPIFTLKDSVLVKSINYKDYRNVNSIYSSLKLFNKKNVDEMIVLNLNKNIDDVLLDIVVNQIDVPVTYGGNILSLSDLNYVYNNGIDKISINSLAYTNKDIIRQACEIYGKQSICCSIDVRNINSQYLCHYDNGQINTNLFINEHIDNMCDLDAFGEFLITPIEKDGTMSGYDCKLYDFLKDKNIRILSNGGGNSNEENLVQIAKQQNIYGLCFSSLFFFTQYTPNDIKKILDRNNIKCANYNK
jgi:cyclase